MRYKGALQKILSTELFFYGLPVLFSRRKKKDPLAILHKIRDSLAMYINSFFFLNQLVTFATVWSSLRDPW